MSEESGAKRPEVFTRPPDLKHKLTKKEAGYVASGPFGCRHCDWFEDTNYYTGNCVVTGGEVKPGACCDYWNDEEAPMDVGKEDAEYVYVPGSSYRCDECKFWQGNNTCTPVIGWISPGASCNKWMPQERKGHWLKPTTKETDSQKSRST